MGRNWAIVPAWRSAARMSRIVPEVRSGEKAKMADVAREATSAGWSSPFFEIQFLVANEDRVLDRGEVAGAVHDDVVDERDVEEPSAGTCSHFLEAR